MLSGSFASPAMGLTIGTITEADLNAFAKEAQAQNASSTEMARGPEKFVGIAVEEAGGTMTMRTRPVPVKMIAPPTVFAPEVPSVLLETALEAMPVVTSARQCDRFSPVCRQRGIPNHKDVGFRRDEALSALCRLAAAQQPCPTRQDHGQDHR